MSELPKRYIPYAVQFCGVSISGPRRGGGGVCYSYKEVACPLKQLAKILGFSLLELPQILCNTYYFKKKHNRPIKPLVSREELTDAIQNLKIELSGETYLYVDPYDTDSNQVVNGLELICRNEFPIRDEATKVVFKRERGGKLFFAEANLK